MAGTYYCAIFINAGKNQVNGLGEIPLTLKVSTVGTAGEGRPDYLAGPTSAKDSDNVADDSGAFGVGAYASIGAGTLALLALAWTIRRRRRLG